MAFEGHGTDISLVAAADFSAQQYRFAKVNSSGLAALADADDLDQIGVIQNNPPSGEAVTVRVAGITKVKAGGTIAAGARVTSDANGAAVAATTGKQILGIALAGAASGDVVSILLSPRGTAA